MNLIDQIIHRSYDALVASGILVLIFIIFILWYIKKNYTPKEIGIRVAAPATALCANIVTYIRKNYILLVALVAALVFLFILIYIIAINTIIGPIKSLVNSTQGFYQNDTSSVPTLINTLFGALILSLTFIITYFATNIWNFHRNLADRHREILQMGINKPDFMNPKKTKHYREEWAVGNETRNAYEAYAWLCWEHAYEIYNRCPVPLIGPLYRKKFIKNYIFSLEAYKRLHGKWFENNKSSIIDKRFVDFIEKYKWREYFDARTADALLWNSQIESYDKEILNPMLIGKNSLFSWDKIKGNDEKRFKDYLIQNYDVNWVRNKKIDIKGDTIKISDGENTLSFSLNINDKEASLKINNRNPYYFVVNKKLYGRWNVYNKNLMLEYINRIPKNPQKKLVVADVGCGNGSFVEILAKSDAGKFEKIYGIDFSDYMVDIAKNKCGYFTNVKFLKEDMKDLTSFREKLMQETNKSQLDMIFSINSILPRDPLDTEKILFEIAETLKPCGEFVAVLPSFDTVEYLKELEFKKRKKDLQKHFENWPWCTGNIWAWLKAWFVTEKLFSIERKMNVRNRLYADDGINVQRFIHVKEIKPMLEKAGLILILKGGPEKLCYPWDLTRKFNYGYFPKEEKEIWDWFVVAKKYLFRWDRIRSPEEIVKGIVLGNDNKRLQRFLKDELRLEWVENAKISKKDDKTICVSFDEKSVEIKHEKYWFSWDETLGSGNGRLIEFLNLNFGIDWVKTAKIEKIDNDMTIRVSTETNYLSLRLNDKKSEVNLRIDDGRIDKLFATKEKELYHENLEKATLKIDGDEKCVLQIIKENNHMYVTNRICIDDL